jgi:hypothetical protein
VDLLLALGFAVRQFHYWNVVGALDRPRYRAIVEATRQRQEAMTEAARRGQPVVAATGLPDRGVCWQCQRACGVAASVCAGCGAPLATPEVRLLRYKTFLCQDVRDHARAGRLTEAQAEQFLTETSDGLAEVRARLAGA